ncbi:MAG: AzlC family ABC transporter permease [Rhodoluna sp.]|nr:AzlC family ABC transporter permease [Rhodoluna sp.]MBP6186920.1 AzlC family ABC transporter permease [Rhodoluna sp.]
MARRQVDTMSLGVGIATGLYGISFGALSVSSGLDVWQTQLLSLLMFSGGSQFAFIGVVASGGLASLPAAIASAWMLGIRNGFYALQMKPLLERLGLRMPIAAQLTIDESTGVATAQGDLADTKRGFWFTGASVFIFWNALTFAGALLGSALADPSVYGLDAAAAAAFLGLLWPRLKQRQPLIVATAAAFIAVSLTPALPSGVPILLAALIAVAVGGFNLFGEKSKSGDQR